MKCGLLIACASILGTLEQIEKACACQCGIMYNSFYDTLILKVSTQLTSLFKVWSDICGIRIIKQENLNKLSGC